MPRLLIFTKIPSSQMQLAVSEEAGKAIRAWEQFSKILLGLSIPELSCGLYGCSSSVEI
jgi:hypothetical protein